MTARREALGTAARNAWALTPWGSGIESPRRTPQTILQDGLHRQLRRYDGASFDPGSVPVLLVPPLAVSADCYDLRPGQSVAAHLLEHGLQPYVIDYGDITFADRRLGFEEWIDDIVPTAIERVSAEHAGALVHLVAWSLGGTISVMTLASHPGLPVASLTALGTPFDYSKIASTELARRVDRRAGGRLGSVPVSAMGGVPRHLTRTAFRLSAVQREITKPLFILQNLTDTETLARMESVDRFMDEMPGYPGRLYLQMYTRLVLRLELARGSVRLSDDRVVELSKLQQRVLLLGSATDAIGPAPAVEAGVHALTGASSAEYAEVAGSHLGMLAGPEARDNAWPRIIEFITR